MNIFIAGNGNVGTALASFFGRNNISFSTLDFGWEENRPEDGLLFLAIPDNEAINTIEKIYSNVPENLKIIYFAGGRPLSRKGVFLFHPYASISKETELEKIFFSLWNNDGEMDNKLKSLGFNLTAFTKPPTVGYHTSAVFAGNFVQYLVLTGKELLLREGFSEEMSERFIYQLLETSLQNIFKNGTKGITGPAARNDDETIKKEIEFLKNISLSGFSELYEKISDTIKTTVKNDTLL